MENKKITKSMPQHHCAGTNLSGKTFPTILLTLTRATNIYVGVRWLTAWIWKGCRSFNIMHEGILSSFRSLRRRVANARYVVQYDDDRKKGRCRLSRVSQSFLDVHPKTFEHGVVIVVDTLSDAHTPGWVINVNHGVSVCLRCFQTVSVVQSIES